MDNWKIFSVLTQAELDSIKGFVVFWSSLYRKGGWSALVITDKDEICGIRFNADEPKMLGLMPARYGSQSVGKLTKVEELSGKGAKKLSIGGLVAALLDIDGGIRCWGCCDDKDGTKVSRPVLLPTRRKFIQVSCGYRFLAGLSTSGDVYVWGRLSVFDEYMEELYLPTDIPVTSISCGDNHVGMLTEDGEVYTWGDGSCGQRGIKSYSSSDMHFVKQMPLNQHCIDVICGNRSTLCLTTAGEVWVCGNNSSNQGHLGVGRRGLVIEPSKLDLPGRIIRLQVNSTLQGIHMPSVYVAATNDGNIYTWGLSTFPYLKTASSLNSFPCDTATPKDTVLTAFSQCSLAVNTSDKSESRCYQANEETNKDEVKRLHDFTSQGKENLCLSLEELIDEHNKALQCRMNEEVLQTAELIFGSLTPENISYVIARASAMSSHRLARLCESFLFSLAIKDPTAMVNLVVKLSKSG